MAASPTATPRQRHTADDTSAAEFFNVFETAFGEDTLPSFTAWHQEFCRRHLPIDVGELKKIQLKHWLNVRATFHTTPTPLRTHVMLPSRPSCTMSDGALAFCLAD